MSDTLEISVNLPANLVRDAREFGLLTDEMVTQLLQVAVEKRVNDVVNEEIHAYRREKLDKSTRST